jgi:arylsulfatase A-like enzyme
VPIATSELGGPRIDIVPTILDVLGVEPPATIKEHTQSPLDGVSMRDARSESGP